MDGKEITFKSQWELQVNTTPVSKARENVGNRVAIGFNSFESDWLREWFEFNLTNHRAKCSKTHATSVYFRQ